MKPKNSLVAILWISIAGMLFSGYLSYKELFGDCEGLCLVAEQAIFGVPVCVYGLLMYLAVFIVSLLGIKELRKLEK